MIPSLRPSDHHVIRNKKNGLGVRGFGEGLLFGVYFLEVETELVVRAVHLVFAVIRRCTKTLVFHLNDDFTGVVVVGGATTTTTRFVTTG